MTILGQQSVQDEWTVELTGEENDLEHWKAQLKLPGVPSVALTKVSEGADGDLEVYLLSAPEFQNCANAAAVRAHAIPMIRVLNGVLALSDQSGPVSLGRVYKRSSDGVYHGTVFADVVVKVPPIRVSTHIEVNQDGAAIPKMIPEPSFAQNVWALGSETLNNALDSRADNWYDLYKAYEALGKKAALQDLGLEEADIRDFTETANVMRHHKHNRTPPRELTFEQGHAFVAKAITERFMKDKKEADAKRAQSSSGHLTQKGATISLIVTPS